MKKPVLLIAGLSSRTQNYLTAFTALGALCHALSEEILCGECADGHSIFPAAEHYSALILPGGEDIDPSLFHQKNQGSRTIEPVLDRIQLRLLRSFLEKGLPVLGICKGMQLINVFFGGNIIQHLPTAGQHEYNGKDQIHLTQTNKGSVLRSLYGECFPVNSAHHQGVGVIGKDLRVIQQAADGVPEALIHSSLPVLGVQWHPERMCFLHKSSGIPDGSLLLSHFLTCMVQPASSTSDQSETPI